MTDFIIGVVLVVAIGAAIGYIVKSKKRGVKCIGCPAAGQCSNNHSKGKGCSCGCSGEDNCGCHTNTK